MGDLAEITADLDYPMMIVTTEAGGERAGCLIGFAAQCSIEPALFMVWLSKANHTYRVARDATTLVVHLPDSAQMTLAELFGGRTGDDTDKFSRVAWHRGPGGAPVLDDCRRWFAGHVLDRVDTGDHVGFLLDPVASHAEPWAGQLGFQDAKRIEPGHPA